MPNWTPPERLSTPSALAACCSPEMPGIPAATGRGLSAAGGTGATPRSVPDGLASSGGAAATIVFFSDGAEDSRPVPAMAPNAPIASAATAASVIERREFVSCFPELTGWRSAAETDRRDPQSRPFGAEIHPRFGLYLPRPAFRCPELRGPARHRHIRSNQPRFRAFAHGFGRPRNKRQVSQPATPHFSPLILVGP